MVNIRTASGDGQVHGEADSSKRQQHEARSSMRVDAQDHKDQADAQAAAADVDASSSGSSVRTSTRDRLLPVAAGRTKSPCKRAASAAPAPAGAATAPDQGAVAAPGLQELPDAAAVAAFPQQQQQQQAVQETSTSTVSPSQQRPRGWLAMLPSPTQDDLETSNVFAADARDQTAGPSILQHVQLPSPAASAATLEQTAAADSATAAAAAQQHPGSASTGVRAPRPTPLLVGCDTPPRTTGLTSSSSRFSQGHGSGSPQQQPGSAGHASASRPPSGLQNRPAALQIQPPASPLGGGCVTPSGFLSPNAMARPYSGPPVLVDDLDLDVIDGVSNDGGTGGSNSASSSPVVNAVLRSGGLRSSRDHGDLRRTALMNQMLSPRPMMSLSTPSSGPPSLVFTGETRARCVGPLPGSGGSTPSGTAEGEGVAPSFNSTAEHLEQLLTSSVRNARGTPPAGSAASPSAAGSICNGNSGSILDRPTRSLPVTPAASRYNVAAAMGAAAGSSSTASYAPPSSSRSSSMTASPIVPPPSHGPAAALLAGSVVPSPRTPRSPLSMVLSPRPGSGMAYALQPGSASAHGTPTALPPPLFGPGVSLAPAGVSAGSSPSADLSSSAALQQPGSARTSFMSPAGSRLSAASPSPTLGVAAALAAAQQQQQLQDYTEQQQQDVQPVASAQREVDEAASEPAISLDGASASVPPQPLARRPWQQQQQQPEHLPQLLRQQLQLHDTRLGPHGESPLSPSHHSALIQQQHRGEGGLRSSPTRPTPLVPPALAAAAAAVHAVRRADAAASAAAAADEAAAAACEVEDVGPRSDVHEWLDQHSWRFSYELPTHLRDAAEFARDSSSSSSGNGNIGHGLVSIITPHNAVSVTAAGPFAGSPPQGGSSRSSSRGSGGGRYGSTAVGARHRQHLAGSFDRSAGAGEEQGLQLQQLGDLASRLERFLPRAAAERSPHASSAAEVPGFDSSYQQLQGVTALRGPAAADESSRMDQDCLDTQQHSSGYGCAAASSSECCDAAPAACGSSFQVLASSRAEVATAAPASAAASSSVIMCTAAQQQQQQQQQQDNAEPHASSSSSRPGGSSVRLLSPGSHRYTAGSPVAADCCCCTCAPTSPVLPAAEAAAAEGMQAVGVEGLGGCSSDAAAAADDERWAAPAAAVEEAGVQLSPARSWQQQLQDGTPAAALHVQRQQQQRQALLQQPVQLGRAAAACAGAADTWDAPTAGFVDSTRASDSAAAAAAAAAADASACVDCDVVGSEYGRKLSAGVLLRDGAYVSQLLASLPGVDARSPHVQHAVRELQGNDVTMM
uniref:Uncharacterized protein n=1 Tax=Tetradesmus obliquus TaxID=3088 RepID=A0A383V6Q4_TETOB|eukprot:jgi/Sobl393_1/3091/SZX61285.1